MMSSNRDRVKREPNTRQPNPVSCHGGPPRRKQELEIEMSGHLDARPEIKHVSNLQKAAAKTSRTPRANQPQANPENPPNSILDISPLPSLNEPQHNQTPVLLT